MRPASAGPQARDDVLLGLGVDGRERVVEHEHARARDQRARERDALALAAREVDAALADQRVVAVRQLVDEGGDAGDLAGGEHLVLGRVGPRGEEVVAQRQREQHGPLRDERDGRAQVGLAQRARRRRRRLARCPLSGS